jgi:hypothetical protein
MTRLFALLKIAFKAWRSGASVLQAPTASPALVEVINGCNYLMFLPKTNLPMARQMQVDDNIVKEFHKVGCNLIVVRV